MNYIKSLVILLFAMAVASCSSSSKDEPDPGPTFVPYDVVDCTITGKVTQNMVLGLSWEVSEITIYRDYKANKDGSLTLIKSEQRKETFPSGSCFVKIPNSYTGATQIGTEVTALPLQMSIEEVTYGNTTLTFGDVTKMLTQEDLSEGSK